MLDGELLSVFAAVARSGSFTRAARQLNRTQSAVSMQIKRLETGLGAVLFRRHGRSIEITREGERLLGYARRILALGEEAAAAMAEERVAGRVRLGAMDDYATRLLPPMLAAFARAHPGIEVELHTGLTLQLLERLGGDFDLVLAMHPAGSGRGTVLCEDQPVWATSAKHALEHRTPLPLALSPQGCLFRRWATQGLDDLGRPWRLAYMSPSLGTVEAAVIAGLAVGVFKASTMSPKLKILAATEGFPDLPRVEIALHRASGAETRAVVLLAEHLEGRLRTEGQGFAQQPAMCPHPSPPPRKARGRG